MFNQTAGIDILTTQYNFAGKVLQTVLRQEKLGGNPQTHIVQTRMTYDDPGRLIQTEKKISSVIGNVNLFEDWKITSQMEYDVLGQLVKKDLLPAIIVARDWKH